MSLAHIFESVGPRCTSTFNGLVQALGNENITQESAPKRLSAESVAQGIIYIVSASSTGSIWNPDVVAKVVNHLTPYLSWCDVVNCFVIGVPKIPSKEGFLFMAETTYSGCMQKGEAYPYWRFFENWGNTRAQIDFLNFVTSVQQTQHIFRDTKRPILPAATVDALYHFYRPYLEPMIQSPWNSQTLIICLLQLLNSNFSDEANRIISSGEQAEPLLMALSLVAIKVDHPRLRTLFYQSINHFLVNHSPRRRLFFEIFRILDKKLLIEVLYTSYRQNRDVVSHSLDVIVELNLFRDTVLFPRREEIEILDFVIELAILSDRRNHLNFETWYSTMLTELGNEMLHHSLEILNLKILVERDIQQGEQCNGIRLSLKEFTTMISTLRKVKMSPNNSENFNSMCAFFDELLPGIRAEDGQDESVTDKQIEEKAEMLFLDLYKDKTTLKGMLDTLSKYRDSLKVHLRNTFKHVIQYPIEEFKFFSNYPDKELSITGKLVGQAIQLHFYLQDTEKQVLAMIIDALKFPPGSKTFRFGVTAIEEFRGRIEEWPSFCITIYKIQHLRQGQYEFFELVKNILSRVTKPFGAGMDGGASGGDYLGQSISPGASDQIKSGPADSAASHVENHVFVSLNPGSLPECTDGEFANPSEDVQDKVQFAVNNLAQNNFDEKLSEVREALRESHYLWFSQNVLVKRASQEPNYHTLYLKFIDGLNSTVLSKCILFETYTNIYKLMNAASTVSSSRDRLQLKNLGSWLGGLTVSRDRPILRENVSFKALLLQGYESDRLIVAIPFVCKVLEQCSKSKVFKPPNPWLMGIMKVLSELYRVAELRLNLKFEIEVLCKALKLDFSNITPSNHLHASINSPQNALLQGLERTSLNDQPSGSSAEASALPSYHPIINLTSNDIMDVYVVFAEHAQYGDIEEVFEKTGFLKNRFLMVVSKVIREFIPQYIVRAVTVAVACTRDTIIKDFCGESDEERMINSTQAMVRSIAGALVVSICRDPLKSLIYRETYNLITGIGLDEHTSKRAATTIALLNLDLACAIAEKEAVDRASAKISEMMNESYHSRKRTREHTGQPFYDMATYGRLVYPVDFPEVLRIKLNPLLPAFLATYEDFARIPHFLSQIPNRPPSVVSSVDAGPKPSQTPGRWSLQSCLDEFSQLLVELDKIVNTQPPNVSFFSLPNTHQVFVYAHEIVNLALQSPNPESMARDFAQALIQYLFRTEVKLGLELYVRLLLRMCKVSLNVEKEVRHWLIYVDDERKYSIPVNAALIKEGLIPVNELDEQLSKLILAGRPSAILFAMNLITNIATDKSLEKSPQDFQKSLSSLEHISQRNMAHPTLIEFLKNFGTNSSAHGTNAVDSHNAVSSSTQETPPTSSETSSRPYLSVPIPDSTETDSYRQMFCDWTKICQHPAAGESDLNVLALQLCSQINLANPTISATFFIMAIDTSLEYYYNTNAQYSRTSCYMVIDALSKLIVSITKPNPAQNTEGDDSKDDGISENSLKMLRIYLISITLIISKEQYNNSAMFLKCQGAYFRLLTGCLIEFYKAHKLGSITKSQYIKFIRMFGQAMVTIEPSIVPLFSSSWLGLLSHRYFFPILISNRDNWDLAEHLVSLQLGFFEPYISVGDFTEPVRFTYLYTIRFLLIVLHDYPEFLAANATSLCNKVPVSCTQLRNLLLSAFPHDMTLPDPSSPNLDLQTISQIKDDVESQISHYKQILEGVGTRKLINDFLSKGQPSPSTVSTIIASFLTKGDTEDAPYPSIPQLKQKYNMPMINSTVVYIGAALLDKNSNGDGSGSLESIEKSRKVGVTLFSMLLAELNPEGSYLLLTGIANQLRYPSPQTLLFSQTLLDLFLNPPEEYICEQIARVLAERLLANRPFPWGLMFTLTELMHNPCYDIWSHHFTKAVPQILDIMRAVADKVKPRANGDQK
ncbi:CCR4-NOT core subunit cdc39 [Mycoemilia scoparia]|uniref:General negative regulator of transcription subunit 1 n=1 Tax=Mycoemilia scoparia TaxID=417184 RepID=A0A9W8DUD9_9FUNG|nr:CCR4-NOT core subunit cdc39 [Mycoemilia scoparia]